MLHLNPLDDYLKYENVLAFENERGINSGMIFGTEKQSNLCGEMLKCYEGKTYNAKHPLLNTDMNKPIFLKEFSGIKWNGKTQIFGSTYIMGCDEYGKIMRHFGTRTWAENLPEYTLRKSNWFIRQLRNPAIFELLESKKQFNKIQKLYQFMVYDFYDLGFTYFVKLQINKRKK